MTLNQTEFAKLSKLAKQAQKLIKRSERLEVGSGSRGLGSLRAFFLPSGAIHDDSSVEAVAEIHRRKNRRG